MLWVYGYKLLIPCLIQRTTDHMLKGKFCFDFNEWLCNKPVVYWLQNRVVEESWRHLKWQTWALYLDLAVSCFVLTILDTESCIPPISAAGSQNRKKSGSWRKHWLKNTLKAAVFMNKGFGYGMEWNYFSRPSLPVACVLVIHLFGIILSMSLLRDPKARDERI